METLVDIQKDCKEYIDCLAGHGSHICGKFETDNAVPHCKNCGYSQFIHLAKRIVNVKSEHLRYLEG